VLTSDVEFGHGKAYVTVPASGSGPGLLVLHAWWGLNPFFKNLCDRLALAGFVALAPDLNEGEVAVTVDEAQRLMAGRDRGRTRNAVLAALDALRAQPGVQPGGLGALGFSMGASWAAYLAAARPDDLAAVVLFYGTQIAEFAAARAAFQGHFAENDEWESAADVQRMKEALEAAGRPAIFYSYPGTEHWFFENDRPEFNRLAAQMAWERTLSFFGRHLGPPEP
jgi:carboxymethylenebutenolidase